ncbi:MAG TPA: acylase [Microscillaceae bacterium]|nr:acylase [Microscillaceae bacterium]
MKWIYTLLITALLFACDSPKQTGQKVGHESEQKNDKIPENSQNNPDLARWQAQAKNVTIMRDDYGVAHVYGKTDADAVFGLLYAQCEDDFNRVERNYIWAIGRLAEVEGEEALYSDVRARLFMTIDEAKANYEKSPEWLKKLCDAFADGINYYLHTHPEVKPKLLTKFEPWMPMYFSEGSIGGDIERVSIAKIKAFYGEETTGAVNESHRFQKYQSPAYQLDNETFAEPRGSNGIAVSGKLTESGSAMLLINPHTSFYFRGEYHCVSEEGLNAYGAITWGQFFIYQGFNEKTGWMHTSTYSDIIDEFVEKVSPQKKGSEEGKQDGGYVYKYGDEEKQVSQYKVKLKYKASDGVKEKEFTLYRTHHGPITQKIGDDWVATALMWKPVKALEQSFTRTKKSGHKEFREMMNIRTNSSNNTVYADAEGNIAYYHGNFIPKRDLAFDYTKPVDGSNPKTDWQGLHTVDECITLLNPANNWLQNCNSTPFTAAAENSPKKANYPRYMSRTTENFRGIHAQQLLKGLKENSLTLDKLITLAYDPRLPAFEQLIPALVKAFEATGNNDEEAKKAIEVLKKWDFKVSKESVAMTLAHFYGMNCLYNPNAKGRGLFPRLNYHSNGAGNAELVALFTKTLKEVKENYGKWDTPWGEVNRFQRLDGSIKGNFDDSKSSLAVGMASGRWGALAAYGSRRYDTKKLYGYRGNSFVAVVEFGKKLKAKTSLAGGQSGDPKSPHFFDQAKPYINAQFKEVAYYREDVEKRAKETYKPGARGK